MNTYITIGAIAAVAVVTVPFLLPASKTVTRSATINAPAEKVFALVASNEGFQTFNPYKLKDKKLKITLQGPSSGIGSGFAFDGKDGKGTQTIVAMEENQSVTMQLDLGAMGKPVSEFHLSPNGDITEVTWSTKSDFGFNPIGRVVGLFLDGMLGPTYELGLKELNKAAQTA
ncbi:MAG: SRPBCC family protein [Pseudomonadota bacterium]